ncbi:glycosyltransferase family 4 protein [Streptomyces reniochalinae]|uniref:D-inositol 3-phosphate glycosyltransferase n=1 Tax=Streptomyces reniochalinae TaxID=2250578 RepID=A0A367EUQ5_9ACTN|nr:glycosyltransferase family 4 protein [Streptomyces reniochalinae]RCG21848.1 glycosyltransferase [Streptomyces reniochalinae]
MPPRHNAGAEHMLVSMLRPLVERGHDVQVWLSRYTADRQVYDYEGVRVVPLAARLDFGEVARRAHVLVSHLENVPATSALARGFGRPFVSVVHNTHRPSFRHMAAGQTALAVYNSLWMRAEADLYFADYPEAVRPEQALVVRPPVFAADYRTTPGDCITLINGNSDKGGDLFWRIAQRMPHAKFLLVKGAYGVQVGPPEPVPNLEIIDHVPGDEMAERVYSRTRVLLMPSRYESWGRTAVEAMASGIPVVAHPTPGLCESLGEAGIFADRDDLDAWLLTLERLLRPSEWRRASTRATARSRALDPTADLAAWCETVETLGRRRNVRSSRRH